MNFEINDGDECVVRNYRDLQFNNFAVDSTNQRIAVTIQKAIAILDLEKPEGPQPLRKLGRQNKYDIRALEWNHSNEKRNLLASTSQYKLDIWDAQTSRDPLYSVKAHTRAISDLNWSYSDPNCIASCSVDSFVYTWDVRDLRKPKLSFKAVAGASCVRWNRLDSHMLASAHDSDIRIWDSRNPSTAVGYISAHVNKVYGLDWSYLVSKRLTTWSQDATVKCWDVSRTREPLHVLKGYTSPVWKALNTPFGHGLVVSLAQHMHGSGDERIFLQSVIDPTTPLHIFTGHTNSILDIQWRFIGKDNCTLVSWSRDYTLRLWKITATMKQGCTLDSSEEMTKSTSMASPVAQLIIKPLTDSTSSTAYLPLSDSSSFSQQPVQTLEQEFSLLNMDNPNLIMERLDPTQRSCTIKIVNDFQLVRLCITFPSHYPNAAPAFILDPATNIDTSQKHELLQKLQDSAQKFMKKGRPSLQVCIRTLASTLKSFSARPVPPLLKTTAPFEIATLHDDHIPFPRSSGARFCPCGILVVFNRPEGLVVPATDDKRTPRSIWKVSSYNMRNVSHRGPFVSPTGSPVTSTLQVPSINRKAKKHPSIVPYIIKESHRKTSKNPLVGLVHVMDASSLLPISLELAKDYVLQASSVKEMCQYNASVALSANRPDLVQSWSVCAMVADSNGPKSEGHDAEDCPWPMHPFARPLIHSLFSHYSKLYDIQTMAMLSCAFQAYDRIMSASLDEDHVDPDGFTIVPQQPKINSPVNHSNGTSDFGDFENLEEEMANHKLNCKLLDHQLTNQCNEVIRCYANVLYCWEKFSLRAELLSFNTTGSNDQLSIGFVNQCNKCTHPVTRPFCDPCKRLALSCSICHVAVKGVSSFCPRCSHGGHLFHMLEWFTDKTECPSGCGCHCTVISNSLHNI